MSSGVPDSASGAEVTPSTRKLFTVMARKISRSWESLMFFLTLSIMLAVLELYLFFNLFFV